MASVNKAVCMHLKYTFERSMASGQAAVALGLLILDNERIAFPRPIGTLRPPSTLPPSTASPRRSLLDLAGSFDAPGLPLDRGRVSVVGRRSPRLYGP